MSKKVGLVGLGAMGLPMGKRLLEAGHDLAVVPHVNRGPAESLSRDGATVRDNVSQLADDREVVILSVPDVPQVSEVLFGESGLASGEIKPGLLVVDMSTIDPVSARANAEKLRPMGVSLLDAPVSGGPARASDGTLTIMVGGDDEAFEAALPVLETLGKNILHVGESGAGQSVKLVNQLMISIIMVANVEALTLGVKAGMPLQAMLDVISTSSGSNYLLQNWMTKTLFTGDLSGGFALDLLVKDLNAALRWASSLGLPTFGGSLVQQLYRIAQSEGSGTLDYSSVAKIYENAAGIELKLS